MTPEQIRSLAQAIADQQLLELGTPFLLGLLITGLVVVGAAFLGSYLRERGKNYATKQDFNNLLDQVKQTTVATTQIKSQIEHDDWRKREYLSVRRHKAEAIITSLRNTRRSFASASEEFFFRKRTDFPGHEGDHAGMLVSLYFPELAAESALLKTHLAYMEQRLAEFANEALRLEAYPMETSKLRNVYTAQFLELDHLLGKVINHFERRLANDMAIVAGVEPPYSASKLPTDEIENSWKFKE